MIIKNIFFLLAKEDIFSYIDIQFAKFINSFYKTNNFLILVSLYLSKNTRLGNISLSLNGLHALILKDNSIYPIIRKLFNIINKNNKITNKIFTFDYLSSFDKVIKTPKDKIGPIILDNNYLYLYKNWFDANIFKQFLIRAVNYHTEFLNSENIYQIKQLLNDHNIIKNFKLNINQKLAILMTLINKLTIITGGPGTGKSNLIIQIIKTIKYISKKNKILIYFLAPTGKASVKLMYLINILKKNIELNNENQISFNIENISTIHKRLNIVNNKEQNLYKSHKLLDILIIDEASMVNLELINNIIKYILYHNKTKFILIGDPYQLNAIESIGLLRNIINFNYDNFYTLKLHQNKNLLINNIVVLNNVYRFKKNSGIAKLANAIKEENIFLIKKIYLEQDKYNDITWYSIDQYNKFINHCVKNCLYLIKNIKYKYYNIINYFKKLQILCLLNKGHYGTDKINEIVERNLYNNNWYNGKPIIILKNDPELLLSNGDIGIIIWNTKIKEFEVIFNENHTKNDLKVKTVKLKSIKHFKSAWSITIHKSQGSEFNKVMLILPPISNYKYNVYCITKELIYTAITRAQKHIIIYASLNTFLFGIKHTNQYGLQLF